MSEKTLYYAQLAEDTARRLTGNWERWAGFWRQPAGCTSTLTLTSS